MSRYTRGAASALLVCVLAILTACRSTLPFPETSDAKGLEETRENFAGTPEVLPEIPADGSGEEALEEMVFPEAPAGLPVSEFSEIWGYVISGSESSLKTNYPLSDAAYFGAEIDSYGHLVNVPNPRRLAGFPGRVHLVVVCGSAALTHFVLEPEGTVRKQLIADLLKTARDFDGLQIDFELVPARDGEHFYSFLGELRDGLGNKMFTAALPARTRTLANDVYDYAKIAPLVDKIFVMAYDEHWSTSRPGPVASLNWCRQVAEYALKTLGREKLVMGIPFYGRTWGSENPNRAFFHSGIERLKQENNITEIRREDGIPTFIYEIPVTVTVYYDDEYSLSSRMELYRRLGITAVGFWRIGQETPAIWPLLKLKKD
jgi:hypothetical protein